MPAKTMNRLSRRPVLINSGGMLAAAGLALALVVGAFDSAPLQLAAPPTPTAAANLLPAPSASPQPTVAPAPPSPTSAAESPSSRPATPQPSQSISTTPPGVFSPPPVPPTPITPTPMPPEPEEPPDAEEPPGSDQEAEGTDQNRRSDRKSGRAPDPVAPGSGARASRIVISSLRIDLPIVPGDLKVRGNRNFYPLCDVAQYMMEFGQPGEVGTTYIYAHAQRGMFLPMLRASRRNNGQEMIGARVEVYTTDSKVHVYEIFRVKRHATNLKLAFNVAPDEHRLVLQTSEGPEGVIPKLQVAARPISVRDAKPRDAMPAAKPRACPPRR
ncbi:MAG: sortase [Chloroflexota bacterium]|nr:sortase [Chloroflexota bacterium]